jgi:hypothetical protein
MREREEERKERREKARTRLSPRAVSHVVNIAAGIVSAQHQARPNHFLEKEVRREIDEQESTSKAEPANAR